MAIFGKGGDLLDYTYLQKRGLIKKNAPDKSEKIVRTKDGFVDLASMDLDKKESKENSNGETSFGNLFNPQAAQESTSGNTQVNEQTLGFASLFDAPVSSSLNSTSSSTPSQGLTSSDMNAVKIKIEDLEFKLSNLIDKLSMIESKLENFEKKVFN